MTRSFIASTLSMLATLAIAYGIDEWIYYQQRIARQNATFFRAYTWVIIGGLILLIIWLVLGWFVLFKSRRILAISIIYIIVGLLAFLWLPLELVSQFWAIHLYLFSFEVYNFQYTGLFLAALGVLMLLPPKTNPT